MNRGGRHVLECLAPPDGSDFGCEPQRLRDRSKLVGSLANCIIFRSKIAAVRPLQAFVGRLLERASKVAWLAQNCCASGEM